MVTKRSWLVMVGDGIRMIASLTPLSADRNIIHMKRTNLVLDEKLLEEATQLSALRTYSKTVDLALSEFVRRARAGRILALAGSGLWEGDLSAMRRDIPTKPNRQARRAAR
jgi:Arc/MetJ family transcription regulator